MNHDNVGMLTGKAQVALVNMPFSFSKYPSIQLGTLSALLKVTRACRRLPLFERSFCPQDRRAAVRIDL